MVRPNLIKDYGQVGSLGLLVMEGIYGSGAKAALKRRAGQAVLDLAAAVQAQSMTTKKGR